LGLTFAGGTSGIGAALCMALARRGHAVFLTGRNRDAAQKVVEQVRLISSRKTFSSETSCFSEVNSPASPSTYRPVFLTGRNRDAAQKVVEQVLNPDPSTLNPRSRSRNPKRPNSSPKSCGKRRFPQVSSPTTYSLVVPIVKLG
jgi:hypothetical protein